MSVCACVNVHAYPFIQHIFCKSDLAITKTSKTQMPKIIHYCLLIFGSSEVY